MARLGLAGTIATDASNGFIRPDLIEQAWQHRRIARGVVRDLDGTDFRGRGITTKAHLAPLTVVVGTVFFRFALTFAQHLDTDTVDQ